jgi:hypothetical protein
VVDADFCDDIRRVPVAHLSLANLDFSFHLFSLKQ